MDIGGGGEKEKRGENKINSVRYIGTPLRPIYILDGTENKVAYHKDDELRQCV